MKISRFFYIPITNLLRKALGKTPPTYHSLKKYLSVSTMKEVKGFPKENLKTLKKEIKDTRQWDEHPCFWVDRIHIVKMATL